MKLGPFHAASLTKYTSTTYVATYKILMTSNSILSTMIIFDYLYQAGDCFKLHMLYAYRLAGVGFVLVISVGVQE